MLLYDEVVAILAPRGLKLRRRTNTIFTDLVYTTYNTVKKLIVSAVVESNVSTSKQQRHENPNRSAMITTFKE